MASIEQRGFRLPDVRRAIGGAWVVEGWGAQSALPGSTTQDGVPDWPAVIGAGRAVHAAIAALPRPAFLDSRTDPWARADRAAWAEAPFEVLPELRDVVVRLRAALKPFGSSPANPRRPHHQRADRAGSNAVDHRLLPVLAATVLRRGHRHRRRAVLVRGSARHPRAVGRTSDCGRPRPAVSHPHHRNGPPPAPGPPPAGVQAVPVCPATLERVTSSRCGTCACFDGLHPLRTRLCFAASGSAAARMVDWR